MLDLALFLTVIGMFVLGLRHPFIWVLAYLYIDILAPQKIGWTLTQLLPISLIAFILAFAGWLMSDSKQNFRFTLRQGILACLLLWCLITLQWTEFPVGAAEKWSWVWKALVFAIFLPFTLTTRLRIESAMLTMVLTAGAIIISGSMKTLLGGGGYGSLSLFVSENSNLYESSTLATASVAIIPLILWFTKHGTIFPPDWRVKLFSALLIFSCLLIPVGTEARTGLICVAVLGVLLLRDVKRRMTYLAGIGAMALVAVPLLPSSFSERMGTLKAVDSDQSASTRVQVWEWTIDYAKEHPFGGGFDAYRANSFTYRMPVRKVEGNSVTVEYREITEKARAYHSAIFEMLGEQGWPGLIMWLSLHGLGLYHMERVRRRFRGRTGADENWQAPLATALQAANIIYLVGATFQGIAYQPFFLLIVGLQIGLSNWCLRRDSEEGKALSKAQRDARRESGSTSPAMP